MPGNAAGPSAIHESFTEFVTGEDELMLIELGIRAYLFWFMAPYHQEMLKLFWPIEITYEI